MQGSIPTPEFMDQIRQMVRREIAEARGERKVVPNRPRVYRDQMWALSPEGGIPAATISGTPEEVELGVAECEIRRDVIETPGETTRVLESIAIGSGEDDVLKANVFNSGTGAISAGQYVPIGMTDNGAWRVQPQATPVVGIVTFSWTGPSVADGNTKTVYKGYPEVTTSTNYTNNDWEWDTSSGNPSEYGLKFLTGGLYPVTVTFGTQGLNLPPVTYDAPMYLNAGRYRPSNSSFFGSGATAVMWYYKDLTYNTASSPYDVYDQSTTGVGMLTVSAGDYAACSFSVLQIGASNGDFLMGAKMVIHPRCNV